MAHEIGKDEVWGIYHRGPRGRKEESTESKREKKRINAEVTEARRGNGGLGEEWRAVHRSKS